MRSYAYRIPHKYFLVRSLPFLLADRKRVSRLGTISGVLFFLLLASYLFGTASLLNNEQNRRAAEAVSQTLQAEHEALVMSASGAETLDLLRVDSQAIGLVPVGRGASYLAISSFDMSVAFEENLGATP